MKKLSFSEIQSVYGGVSCNINHSQVSVGLGTDETFNLTLNDTLISFDGSDCFLTNTQKYGSEPILINDTNAAKYGFKNFSHGVADGISSYSFIF